jgi:hypothetical protein
MDPSSGDAVTKINLKKVFATCREKFRSINGAPVSRLLNEGMRQERAMLAQTETFGNRNGRPGKSDGLHPQFAKLKKELTFAKKRDFESQEPTIPSQGEHREGTC